jgi:hypothetical protein
MLIRGDWRALRGDPPESGPFRTVVTWAAAVVFAAVWAVGCMMLLGALAFGLL